jgi:hypothetical protein
MMNNHNTNNRLMMTLVLLILGAATVLLVIAALPVWVHAAPSALPPRPTSEPTPTPQPMPAVKPRPGGGVIELRVQFAQGWSWTSIPWQELWTVIQWQDWLGNWHNVQGWQGGLDNVLSQDGQIVGTQSWWVDQADLAKGPFRWVIYHDPAGQPLATSDPFYLPRVGGQTVQVPVLLSLRP